MSTEHVPYASSRSTFLYQWMVDFSRLYWYLFGFCERLVDCIGRQLLLNIFNALIKLVCVFEMQQ